MEQPRKLLFASHNLHKVEEMRRICGPRFRIVSLADVGCTEDIPEDGLTLDENARAKALWVFRRYGLPCFADDTGLEVDALGGQPGVHTARFAGPECDSKANVALLLERLQGQPDRTARFRTVIAFVDADGTVRCFNGEARGRIAAEPEGAGGFGYDPVFIPDDGPGCTFALMSAQDKNAISHRGRATASFLKYLESAPCAGSVN
ncbi:MAG: RdgB/HAM1 family non-canonical purine NTP pyrophosphatase [Muribaculaceae bacterium]|nr:RdgB/HAM1 family non-canonical purine NTP pyrophosphatase [Muribaculaceae bacterium]